MPSGSENRNDEPEREHEQGDARDRAHERGDREPVACPARPGGGRRPGRCGSGARGGSECCGGCGGSQPPGMRGRVGHGPGLWQRDLWCPRARRRNMLPMAVPALRRPDPTARRQRARARRLPRRARRAPARARAPSAGSAEDFEALFALHWPRAYRTAWLVVHDAAAAEDIAQEAFIAALRALDSFDRRRPFGPWLNRIVVNRAIDWARARRLQAGAGGVGRAGRRRRSRRAGRRRSSPPCARCRSTSARSSCCATGSATRRARSRGMLDLPRGTVNSRLRRALDRLGDAAGGRPR